MANNYGELQLIMAGMHDALMPPMNSKLSYKIISSITKLAASGKTHFALSLLESYVDLSHPLHTQLLKVVFDGKISNKHPSPFPFPQGIRVFTGNNNQSSPRRFRISRARSYTSLTRKNSALSELSFS